LSICCQHSLVRRTNIQLRTKGSSNIMKTFREPFFSQSDVFLFCIVVLLTTHLTLQSTCLSSRNPSFPISGCFVFCFCFVVLLTTHLTLQSICLSIQKNWYKRLQYFCFVCAKYNFHFMQPFYIKSLD